AGFIGSALTRRLLEAKASITVFDNFSFGSRKNIWKGFRVIQGDLRKIKNLNHAFRERYDVVFHLAALHFIPYCNEHPLEAVSVNIEGTLLLLDALKRTPPGRLFFASTAAVYDTTSVFHREDEIPSPMDIYGVCKHAGEHLVQEFHRETGVVVA